jgi:hypothetical protein
MVGDDFGSTVDVGCHASRFGSGKATVVAPRPSWSSSASMMKVDGRLRGTGVAEPVEQWCAGGP